MKKLRKIVSLLLAVVMMMSLCVAVSATTQEENCGTGDGIINISDVTEGKLYEVYKMLDLSYDEDNDAYTYTIADGWYNFFSKAEYESGVLYVDITEATDSQGNKIYYVTWNEDEVPQDTATLQAFAQAAEKYAESATMTANGSATVASGTTILSFTGLDLGYYFITSEVGSLVALDSTAYTAEVVDKNDKPNVEKSVSNDGGTTYYKDYVTADIDDEIYFKIIIQGVDEISELVLHDDLPAGYTLDTTTLTVKLYSDGNDEDPKTLVANTDYTYTNTTGNSCSEFATNRTITACDFELDFALLLAESTAGEAYYEKVLSLTSGADEAYIEVIYKVTVDSTDVATNSVVTDTATANTNTAYITSSTGITKSDTASVYYFELYIYKYTTDDAGNETALADADFVLSYTDGSTYYAVVTGSDGEYTLSKWTTDSTRASTLTTNDSGIIHVIGLDDRTYTFTETKAPKGYALLSDTFKTAITATNVQSSTGDYISTVAISNTSEVEYETNTVNATKVLNTTNSAMPSTGGIGTTIFYVVGGILVVVAVVLLITKRRMKDE